MSGCGAPCRQGLTLFSISAQLELPLPISAELELPLSPTYPKFTQGCVPEMLKLSCNVSDVFPKVLKLSSEVSECKPLHAGPGSGGHHGGGGHRQELTLVHFSAQPKPFWSHLPVSPCLIDQGKIKQPTHPTKHAYVEPNSGRV